MAALLALLCSALWGTSDFTGGMLARRLPAVAVVGASQPFGLAAVAVAVLVTGGFGGFGGWLPWSVLAALAGSGGLITFYTALATGTMGVVSPIAALGAVVPVAGGLLSGDVPTGLQVAGMLLGLVGAVAASGPELSGGRGSAGARSVLLAALAGLLFGIAILAIQRGAAYDPLLVLGGMRTISIVLFVLAAVLLRSIGGVRVQHLPGLAFVGVVDVGANIALAYATTLGMASVVAVLAALYPVITVLLGAVVLGERLNRIQRTGVALALGGVALLAAG